MRLLKIAWDDAFDASSRVDFRSDGFSSYLNSYLDHIVHNETISEFDSDFKLTEIPTMHLGSFGLKYTFSDLGYSYSSFNSESIKKSKDDLEHFFVKSYKHLLILGYSEEFIESSAFLESFGPAFWDSRQWVYSSFFLLGEGDPFLYDLARKFPKLKVDVLGNPKMAKSLRLVLA